jgi:hypothetical protein
MEAVLKGLYSSEIAEVESYQPEKEDKSGFVLRTVLFTVIWLIAQLRRNTAGWRRQSTILFR